MPVYVPAFPGTHCAYPRRDGQAELTWVDNDNMIRSKPTRKLKHTNSILEYFEYFCQMSSKSIVTILRNTVSKLARFFETQCSHYYCPLWRPAVLFSSESFSVHSITHEPGSAYLHSLLNYHTPTRCLRSANTNMLSAPRVRTTFASRGFSVAAPAVWNSLPSGIRDSYLLLTMSKLFAHRYPVMAKRQ